MAVVIRDIQDKEMTIYNPDGTILVVTHNMMCVLDVLIQIREQGLDGYTFQAEGEVRKEITKYGRIKYGFKSVYSEQVYILLGMK